ncbi:DeoR/GlpR family DNA-binding transcription regulator [Carnobacterium gallinarum]|uniref:DeoR/GlpR family DNA-binding transcription regulator n=1 Tax=Carnobacterium gallinarum TaxID=2749 RepID=UPI00068FEDBE|nr:DeoR/GlpR family DNA-binding transcription regulator [Carnobacterium gallinarum]
MSIVTEHRQVEIIKIVNTLGKAQVKELATYFHVSTETIRRDLQHLTREKKVEKIFGGAKRISSQLIEPPIGTAGEEIKELQAKRKIAEKAASYIKENELIILDEGTTTLQMLPFLCRYRSLKIITNSFQIANELMNLARNGKFKGKLIFIGGVVQLKHQRSLGLIAEKMIQEFYVDRAFLSADGYSEEYGITGFDLEKVQLTKLFLKQAKRNYFLLDKSKQEFRTNYHICDYQDVDDIISA